MRRPQREKGSPRGGDEPGACGRPAGRPGWSAAVLAGALAGCAQAPSVLRPASRPEHTLATLGWWLLIVGALVVLIIGVLELIPLRHRGRSVTNTPLVTTPASTRGIVIGVLISAAIMAAFFIYTMLALSATAHPNAPAGLTLEVIGHRWWWEARYVGSDPSQQVTTANELHIPVGVPVRLQVTSADVIHSFWVPQLQGKIDLIPGQWNTFWIRADAPGRYHGQCAEYCGLQHAHMMLFITAEPMATFRRWLADQRRAAPEPQGVAAAGRAVFLRSACSLCHTIRGTDARGVVGPDLTHVASRQTIAGGTLPNTRGTLAGWIVNAPSLKPGVAMPRIDLDPRSLHAILAYLETLR
jgi:cytochrome c oxidase subunit 2